AGTLDNRGADREPRTASGSALSLPGGRRRALAPCDAVARPPLHGDSPAGATDRRQATASLPGRRPRDVRDVPCCPGTPARLVDSPDAGVSGEGSIRSAPGGVREPLGPDADRAGRGPSGQTRPDPGAASSAAAARAGRPRRRPPAGVCGDRDLAT